MDLDVPDHRIDARPEKGAENRRSERAADWWRSAAVVLRAGASSTPRTTEKTIVHLGVTSEDCRLLAGDRARAFGGSPGRSHQTRSRAP